ncbi:hypothetical protein EVAR_22274_1 [Eumeta japonica]|uniref:Uncharacterized protein n=1 Tax=Eumeta variegata TaxID=151549 RepID=A0A4C1UAH6_EUMVA|nr:hypothetical protein EVAR_22274_1 [Eumeta japonica]
MKTRMYNERVDWQKKRSETVSPTGGVLGQLVVFEFGARRQMAWQLPAVVAGAVTHVARLQRKEYHIRYGEGGRWVCGARPPQDLS